MSASAAADVAVVGSGVCGLLVARELLRAGRQVTIIERGASKDHAAQLRDGEHERDVPTAAHSHEHAPGTPSYPWDYVYGVGGNTLHWAGVSPRLLPSDFELRSRYGVGRDWPIGYHELEPHYEAAEQALHVAGGPDAPAKRRGPYPQPAHPYAPVDRLVAPPLGPYYKLPQARPTESVNGRPACCGSARCRLCPVDARYSALHTLLDSGMRDSPGFTLLEGTIAARLRASSGQVASIECVSGEGERSEIRPRTVVLAANGIENASILLRSGFDDPDIGRWLFDHAHRLIHLELDRDAGSGRGATLATGISYAFADGDWRSKRPSTLVYPFNPGLQVAEMVIDRLAAGASGKKMRRELRAQFDRTLVLDSVMEDLPRADRRVTLSPSKDGFGLPRNRIAYRADSAYVREAHRHLDGEVTRRLRPIGGRIVRTVVTAEGGHQLGTCYMGERDGVVDPNLRHHRVENLYVAGGSAFPSYSAHHPTLTIAALAIRLGRHLGRG